MMTILVTGATGTVGSKVTELLAGHPGPGIAVRAAARTPASVPRIGNVTAVEFDFDSPESMERALRGVDRVFLLAPAIRDQVGTSSQFVALAASAGVKHIVKLSALGCDAEPAVAFGRAHREVELAITRSAMTWTFLRPNNFMDNFLGLRHGAFAPDETGEIRLPWGTGACSFIASDDIAAVAAHVLAEPRDTGATYELTGPEALRIDEVADRIASATGLRVRYADVSEAEARAAMALAHMPAPMIDGMMELHALGKAGRTAIVTSTVAELIGRPAINFRTFAGLHAATWSRR